MNSNATLIAFILVTLMASAPKAGAQTARPRPTPKPAQAQPQSDNEPAPIFETDPQYAQPQQQRGRKGVTRQRPQPQQPRQQVTTKAGGYYAPSGPVLNLALTHLLPSAFVIPAGTLVLGTDAGFGIANVADIETNLYMDLEQVYNVGAKVSIIHGRNFALAPWVFYTSQTTLALGTDATGAQGIVKVTATAIKPGLTMSYRLGRNFIAHTGGNWAIFSPVIPKGSLKDRTAYIQGNTINQEFTFGLNKQWALSLGGSYDLTYEMSGAGISAHVSNFQFGFHTYFPNVTEGSIQPILGWSFATTL